MIHNLAIECTANMSLVFSWKGEKSANVWYAILAEDPLSGAPFIYLRGPVRGLHLAASDAWRFLAETDMFAVHTADHNIRSVRDVWRRDFGSDFSQAIKVCENGAKSMPGVYYASWHEHVKGGKMPLE